MFANNKPLAIISLIAVVNALGYAIIIPVLYSYSLQFGLNAFQNGLLFALYSVGQFVSTPIIGRMSDKFGRKPLLLLSLMGSALSFFMMAFAPSAMFLFFARFLDGITAGNLPVASAVISDTTNEKDRAKGFGIIGAAFGFGFIFGPLVSALTVKQGTSIPFIIAGLVSLLAVAVTFVALPETNKHIGEVKKGKLFDFGKLVHSLKDANIGPLLLITLLGSIGFSSFFYGFNAFSVEGLHMSPNQIAIIFSLIGVIGLITQLGILPRVTQKFGVGKPLYVALVTLGLVFLGLYFARNMYVYIVLCSLIAFPNSFINPLTQTLLSKETDMKSQGSIQGLNASYMSIGQMIGPIIAGLVAFSSASLTFVVASIMMFLSLPLAAKALKPDHRKESAF
jgi:MFS family permease